MERSDLSIDLQTSPEMYAAIYARKSTKMENNSIESQILLAKDVLEKNNLLLYRVYSDEESATRIPPKEREGCSALIKDAQNNHFKTVIVFRRDRLARKVDHLIELKRIFDHHNIKIIYSNPQEYQPNDSYISSFVENVIMAVDELEPQVISERTAAGKLKKRENGEYSGTKFILFGYDRKIVDNIYHYNPNKEETKIVKFIFNKFVNMDYCDSTMNLIRNHINDEFEKINTLDSDRRNKKITPFDNNDILKIIKNPVYCSKIITKEKNDIKLILEEKEDEIIINTDLLTDCINVKPIIDFETWKSAITKWYKNRPKKKNTISPSTYLFKGLLECSACKKKISLQGKRYRCSTNGCTSIKEYELRHIAFDAIMKDIATKERIIKVIDEKIKKNEADISDKKRQSALNKKKLNGYLSVYIENPEDKQLKNVIINLNKEEKDRQEVVSNLELNIFNLERSKRAFKESL